MIRKLPNTTRAKLPGIAGVAVLLVVWQLVCVSGLVPSYMLPSPVQVVTAFVTDAPSLWENLLITLQEAALGLCIGVAVGFVFAVAMDAFELLYKIFYPILVITQTIPTVAIAPLLVLWFGYEMTPKVILVVLVTFFPVTVGLLDGFRGGGPRRRGASALHGSGAVADFPLLEMPLGSAPVLFRAAHCRRLLHCGRRHQRVAGRLRRSGCVHDPGEKGLCL